MGICKCALLVKKETKWLDGKKSLLNETPVATVSYTAHGKVLLSIFEYQT